MLQDVRELRSPSPPVIRAALRRICASHSFKAAPRLASFLRFVVEAVLDGRGGSIKAYTVAVEALGRPASFDPGTDACVRVEACRLRLALSRYYESEGTADLVMVSLPLGTYVPTFRWRRTGNGLAADAGTGALVTFIDAVAQSRTSLEELSVRVEGVLKTVADLTATCADSDAWQIADFFVGRIRSAATWHALLARADWGEVALADILAHELLHYRTADGDRVSIQGPAVSFTPFQTIALSVAIHELASASSKHGALSCATGQLSVAWGKCDVDGNVIIGWRDVGGAWTHERARALDALLDRELRSALSASVAFDCAGDRLLVDILMPLDMI